MNERTFRAVFRTAMFATALFVPAMLACALWLSPAAEASLSPSEYEVGALCSAPPPGYAGCLGLRLIAKQPLAVRGARALRARGAHASPAAGPSPATAGVPAVEYKEPWPGSLSPQNVLSAYSLSAVPAPARKQTLALVDAYNDPTAEHDLKVFDEQYALPACTAVNRCFKKVEMKGGTPATLPPENADWAQEIATDVEVAHGICPSCRILLVEAHSASYTDLEAAETEAERLGATEISNSWGGSELGATPEEDDASPFNHPGTVITASSGDDGYLGWGAHESSVEYPAASPHVVAVGGTRLSLGAGGTWSGETVWNGDGAGGGGCSTIFEAPAWQQSVAGFAAVGCGSYRAVADVSADADPYTGVAVYDSTPVKEAGKERSGWVTMGGTSVASPIIAGTFALAGGAGHEAGGATVSYPAQTLYQNLAGTPGSLHDVVSGSNGECRNAFNRSTGESACTIAEEGASCSQELICIAGTGFDGPSGVGTPDGITAFQPDSSEPQGSGSGAPGGEEESEGTEEAPGSEGDEATGGQPVTGGQSGTGTTTTGPAHTSSVLSTPVASLAAPASLAPVLSRLALTHNAITALHRGSPTASQLGFAFTISATARVRVTLAKRVQVRGHARWQPLAGSFTIAARRGGNSRRLHGSDTLSAGRYRLLLTPARGSARSLSFQVG